MSQYSIKTNNSCKYSCVKFCVKIGVNISNLFEKSRALTFAHNSKKNTSKILLVTLNTILDKIFVRLTGSIRISKRFHFSK